MNRHLLEISSLKLGFPKNQSFYPVVHGIDLHVNSGEIIGILGESGSGKTISLKSIFGVKEEDFVVTEGQIYFDGQELLKLPPSKWADLRGRALSYIPQNASDSLTPHQSIRKQLLELAKVHRIPLSPEDLLDKLKSVGIEQPEAILSMYPHQLSGGLAQRVLIAMSTILSPKLTVADEPTSAIDASLKGTVLALLKAINERDHSAMVIITHDFDVVSEICNRVYVMYKGLIMEQGPTQSVLNNPSHPYTKGLIQCVASLSNNQSSFFAMPEASEMDDYLQDNLVRRCPFATRCPEVIPICFESLPTLNQQATHACRCHLEEVLADVRPL